VELTKSYERVFSEELRARYIFAEVRNASAALSGTNPVEFEHLGSVLTGFWLTLDSLTDPGGGKSDVAADLDLAFRHLGWREAGHTSKTLFRLNFSPWPPGTPALPAIEFEFETSGHKVDNFRGRVALDVEWNAKDGNLDRDLANFRALHEVGLLDVGVLITRHHERTKWVANYLADIGDRVRYDARGRRIVLLGTTTTTNLEKLLPRLERGDAGGCPVLAVALTERCYRPGDGDPVLPVLPGPPASGLNPEENDQLAAQEPEEAADE
jgi:hypothetical protein